MKTNKCTKQNKQQDNRNHMRREGHYVESMLLKKIDMAIYVPSVSEIRAKSDIIQPFCGQMMSDEVGFRCTMDVGTALMRLIESFGLPNAPEYHEWSQEFMDFKRETSFWEYIFEVNGKHYLYVSHSNGRLVIGCKGALDRKTSEAFSRFIESKVNRSTEDLTCGYERSQ